MAAAQCRTETIPSEAGRARTTGLTSSTGTATRTVSAAASKRTVGGTTGSARRGDPYCREFGGLRVWWTSSLVDLKAVISAGPALFLWLRNLLLRARQWRDEQRRQ